MKRGPFLPGQQRGRHLCSMWWLTFLCDTEKAKCTQDYFSSVALYEMARKVLRYFPCPFFGVSTFFFPCSKNSWLQWLQNQHFPWLARPTAAIPPRNYTAGFGLLFPPISMEIDLILIEIEYMFQSPHLILEITHLQIISHPPFITNCPLKRHHYFGGNTRRMIYVFFSLSSIIVRYFPLFVILGLSMVSPCFLCLFSPFVKALPKMLPQRC